MQLFIHLVILFAIYSGMGWLCESVYCSLCERRWVNRGFLNGPFCPIYGFGGLLVITILTPLSGRLATLPELFLFFVLGAVSTSVLEYITGYALEKLFHTSWWDYSSDPFNLHGRVCLKNSLLFGLMTVFTLKLLHPAALALLAKIPPLLAPILAGGLTVYFLFDCAVTVLGILQMNGKLEQLQQILDELREKTGDATGERLAPLVQTLDELRERAGDMTGERLAALSQTLDELREKAGDATAERLTALRQALDGLREKAGDATGERLAALGQALDSLLNDEIRSRVRLLQDRREYMEQDSLPIHRRIMEAFPRMRSIRTPESFARFKNAAKKAGRLSAQARRGKAAGLRALGGKLSLSPPFEKGGRKL